MEALVNDGVHILAMFDPEVDKSRIDDVLARAHFPVLEKEETVA